MTSTKLAVDTTLKDGTKSAKRVSSIQGEVKAGYNIIFDTRLLGTILSVVNQGRTVDAKEAILH